MEMPEFLGEIGEGLSSPLESMGEGIMDAAASAVPEIAPEITFDPPTPELASLTGEAYAQGLYDACIHPEYADPYVLDRFSSLRDEVHDAQALELNYRYAANPQPSPQEIAMGCYAEMLEPQVREAAMTMWAKGYATNSSGFYGYGHNLQVIDGDFDISPSLADDLRDYFGVTTEQVGSETSIGFWMSPADTLDSLTERWNAVANFLPQKSQPAAPNYSLASEIFREELGITPSDVLSASREAQDTSEAAVPTSQPKLHQAVGRHALHKSVALPGLDGPAQTGNENKPRYGLAA